MKYTPTKIDGMTKDQRAEVRRMLDRADAQDAKLNAIRYEGWCIAVKESAELVDEVAKTVTLDLRAELKHVAERIRAMRWRLL